MLIFIYKFIYALSLLVILKITCYNSYIDSDKFFEELKLCKLSEGSMPPC